MRCAGTPRLYSLLLVFGAVVFASALIVISPYTRTVARADCAASSPCPTPTPVNAFISLDVTQGPATTVINVSGGQFNPNEQLKLFWDTSAHVAGTTTADGGGSFNTRVQPYSGMSLGVHHLCASVPPNPCANFTLTSETPTPSPSAGPVEETPTPTAPAEQTPVLIATPARVSSNLSGFEVISKPPFVFLPIFGIGALLLSLGYWAVTAMRGPRRLAPIPSAAVVHRATRPDYSAGFGTPPPVPGAQPEASAWDEPMRTLPPTPPQPAASQAPESAAPPAPEQAAEWGPPVEWGTGAGGWGIAEPPPEDESGDESPEAPPPSD